MEQLQQITQRINGFLPLRVFKPEPDAALTNVLQRNPNDWCQRKSKERRNCKDWVTFITNVSGPKAVL